MTNEHDIYRLRREDVETLVREMVGEFNREYDRMDDVQLEQYHRVNFSAIKADCREKDLSPQFYMQMYTEGVRK